MNDYERMLIKNQRNYKVVKSNDLVLASRFNYSLSQQKMLAFICSKIKPTVGGQYQLDYEFEIADYIRLMGIEKKGDVYNEIKATIKSLRDKSYWIEMKNGSETLVSWVNKVYIKNSLGLVKYRIDEDLASYLFELKERYLQYDISNVLNFKSKFSIRIYEIIKAHYDLKRSQHGYKFYETPTINWIVDLEDLRHMLMLNVEDEKQKYSRYPDFRRYVLESAQKDINQLSDMYFDLEPITKGRKVIKIKFLIRAKEVIERINSANKNNLIFKKTSKKI